MDLEFRSEYWNDRASQEAFKNFLYDIHGLDLSAWEAAGYWDSAYMPFSYFKDGRVVSSVCLYLLDAVVNGVRSPLVQISGVGTLPAFRRKGLNRELTERALAWTLDKHAGVFLFADEGAIPYYQRCGFVSVTESQESWEAEAVDPRAGIIQLDPENPSTLKKIYRYAVDREPVSEKLSILSPKLLMFHILYTLRDSIYEVPELDCIILYDRKGSEVNIYDIIAKEMPVFSEIYPYFSQDLDKRVIFHFHTDRLGIDNVKMKLTKTHNTFVSEGFPVRNPAFPFTSRA